MHQESVRNHGKIKDFVDKHLARFGLLAVSFLAGPIVAAATISRIEINDPTMVFERWMPPISVETTFIYNLPRNHFTNPRGINDEQRFNGFDITGWGLFATAYSVCMTDAKRKEPFRQVKRFPLEFSKAPPNIVSITGETSCRRRQINNIQAKPESIPPTPTPSIPSFRFQEV